MAAINSDLVVRDRSGEIYTVRYEAINAMLLNEFLKEHRVVREQNSKIQQQEATITELKSTVAQQKKDFQATVAQLTARLDEQASQIQKASAQLATASPARDSKRRLCAASCAQQSVDEHVRFAISPEQ